MTAIIITLLLSIVIFDPGTVGTLSEWFGAIMLYFADHVPDITQSVIQFGPDVEAQGITNSLKTLLPISASLILVACILQALIILKRKADHQLFTKTAEVFVVTILMLALVTPALHGALDLTEKIVISLRGNTSIINPLTSSLESRQAELIESSNERKQLVDIAAVVGNAECLGALTLQNCLGGKYKAIFEELSLYAVDLMQWISNHVGELIAIAAYISAMIFISIAFIGKTALLLTLYALHVFIIPFFIFDHTRNIVWGYLQTLIKLLLIHPILYAIIYFSSHIASSFDSGFQNNSADKVGIVIVALILGALTFIVKHLIQKAGDDILSGAKQGISFVTENAGAISSKVTDYMNTRLSRDSLRTTSLTQQNKITRQTKETTHGRDFSAVRKITLEKNTTSLHSTGHSPLTNLNPGKNLRLAENKTLNTRVETKNTDSKIKYTPAIKAKASNTEKNSSKKTKSVASGPWDAPQKASN